MVIPFGQPVEYSKTTVGDDAGIVLLVAIHGGDFLLGGLLRLLKMQPPNGDNLTVADFADYYQSNPLGELDSDGTWVLEAYGVTLTCEVEQEGYYEVTEQILWPKDNATQYSYQFHFQMIKD